MVIACCMISCAQRDAVRTAALACWASSDWGDALDIQLDRHAHADVVASITVTWRCAIERAAQLPHDWWLFVEDDVEPNRFIRHNLGRWPPLAGATSQSPFFATLYRCNQPLLYRNDRERYAIAAPEAAWGSQALLLSRATIRHIVTHWSEVDVPHHDLRMGLLAARISPIYVHLPSLVQHGPVASTWGNAAHRAADFDREWLSDD